MVHGAALEKRSLRKWSVGSNPTLSAIIIKLVVARNNTQARFYINEKN